MDSVQSPYGDDAPTGQNAPVTTEWASSKTITDIDNGLIMISSKLTDKDPRALWPERFNRKGFKLHLPRVVFLMTLVMAVNCAGLLSSVHAAGMTSARPVRALHLVMWGMKVTDAKRLITLAKEHEFNTLIVALGDAVKLTTFPGRPFAGAWSSEEFKGVVNYARQQGLTVVPEVKLLTHQKRFFGDSHPELMLNRESYDPENSRVYDAVLPYLDELIQLIHPHAIHIGHDEVFGHSPWTKQKLSADEKMLPAELFLKDVNRIHAHLKSQGVETWMWGDMLIAPDEFPGMHYKSLHGGAAGYGRDLRAKLPKDMVICDWHYTDSQTDFPSLQAFKAAGFRVLGATWKKSDTIRNLSRYAAEHGAEGMIATTWFHVRRQEWDVVERIVSQSGKAFRSDFPDAR